MNAGCESVASVGRAVGSEGSGYMARALASQRRNALVPAKRDSFHSIRRAFQTRDYTIAADCPID